MRNFTSNSLKKIADTWMRDFPHQRSCVPSIVTSIVPQASFWLDSSIASSVFLANKGSVTSCSSTAWSGKYHVDCRISGTSFLRTRCPFRFLSSSSLGSPLYTPAVKSLNGESFEAESCSKDGNFDCEDNDGNKLNIACRSIDEIIDAIRREEKDMETKFNSMARSLQKFDVVEIFQVLNRIGAPALRFFYWIRLACPHLYGHDVCNLMVDNCGRLKKYDTMLLLLKDFRSRGICLTRKAFGFVVGLYPQDTMVNDIDRVVLMLNEVGGSCGNSGVHSLIWKLCDLGLFVIAKRVIEMTGRRLSCYKMLIRGLCRRRMMKDAKYMLGEMRAMGCDPDVDAYNYVHCGYSKQQDGNSLACQVFREMSEYGLSPNAVTFEMLIYQSCCSGNIKHAIGLYEQMVSIGIQPRCSTHVVFINHYFDRGEYEKAYSYIVDSSMQDKFSANKLYSLLASRHRKKGNLINAHYVLLQMIQKHLLPDCSIYRRVLRGLRMACEENLARDLEATFHSLTNQ
ncbi:hypothetical protein Dimus_029694 [Dionaea muscipula]